MVTTKTELDSQSLVSNFSTLAPGELSAPRTATRLAMFTDFFRPVAQVPARPKYLSVVH